MATTLQISATAFSVEREELDPSDWVPEVEPIVREGTLTLRDPRYRFYAPVVFHRGDLQVCSFSMVFEDTSNRMAVARLMRKQVSIGADAKSEPVQMVQITSFDTQAGIRKSTRTAIAHRILDVENSFYYVELFTTGGAGTVKILGVQLDVRLACT